MKHTLIKCRMISFTELSLIGDVWSLIPTGVRFLAHNAMATTETYHFMLQYLSKETPTLVSVTPGRGNILYSVHPKANLDQFSNTLCKQIVELEEFPKTIFVQKYWNGSDLYLTIRHKLVDTSNVLPGYLNISQIKQIKMYS